MRSALFAFLGSVLLFASTTVRADTPPSVWDRARDPESADAFELHRAARQRLLRTSNESIDLGEQGRVLAMLERAGAEQSKNPLLRFDLAHVYALLKNYERSAQIDKAALAEFPDHPAAEEAWSRLSDSCGRLGDHECELLAHRQVLRLETEEILRATPTLNLAETEMHLGNLKEAIELYREAFRIAGRVPSGDTPALALWGLAVALDRSGDAKAAEKEARFALELQLSMGHPNLLHSEHVFFVPDYEVLWYEGLGAAAVAAASKSPREAVDLWSHAEKAFRGYVEGGTAKNDRWLPIAKARLSAIKAARERAEKAAARAPRATHPLGGDVPL